MDKETFDRETANKYEERDVSVRAVKGGYVIQGARRFMANETGLLAFSFTAETVASSTDVAAMAVGQFLVNGAF